MEEVLGTVFLNGRMINLDSLDSNDLEKYMEEARNSKKQKRVELDKIAEYIKNS